MMWHNLFNAVVVRIAFFLFPYVMGGGERIPQKGEGGLKFMQHNKGLCCMDSIQGAGGGFQTAAQGGALPTAPKNHSRSIETVNGESRG
jgi:hypothetical protein